MLVALIVSAIIVVLGLSYTHPRFVFYLYAFAISANGMTFEYKGITIRPEIFALALLPAILRKAPRDRRRTRPWLVLCAAAWSVLALASSLYGAPEPAKSLWVALQIASGMAVMVLLKSRETSGLFHAITKTTGLLAILSIFSWVTNLPAGSAASAFGVADDGRLIGLSFETNIFASQMACWLAVMYVMRRQLTRGERRLVIPLVLAVTLAETRAAWLALIAVFLIILWDHRRSWSGAVVTCGLIAAAGVGALMARAPQLTTTASADGFWWRLTHILDTTQGTGAYRVGIYRVAIADIDSIGHLLFGTGPNSFSQFHLIDSTGVAAPYLSSVWIAMVYDTGIIGLLLFLLVVLGAVSGLQVLGVARLAVPVSLLLCASATNLFWFQYAWVCLAVIAAPAVATVGEGHHHQHESLRARA